VNLQKLSVPPQRSVILDAELGKRTSGELVGVMLAGLSKLNDLLRDQLVIRSSKAMES
jgi:hypothetical protein